MATTRLPGSADGTAPISRAVPEDVAARAKRRRRRGVRLAVLNVGLVLALVIGTAVGFALFVQHRVDAAIERFDDPFTGLTDRPPAASDRGAVGTDTAATGEVDDAGEVVGAAADDGAAGEAAAGDPVNILILGSDSRISAGDPTQWQVGAQRTDAIMVAQVSGDRRTAHLMSIPRDSWVEIPGHGKHKINAAYSFGGPTLMIQTVEALTGIRFDHFAIADFESFAVLTDELGGVEIELSQPLQIRGGGVVEAGRQQLDGEQALSYARERYGLSGGDFSRVQRQQNWMRAVGRAAFDREVLTNPIRLTGFLEAVGRSVAVDENFTMADMRSLALSMRNLRPDDIAFLTAPYAGIGRSPDGAQSIVHLDRERFDPLARAFATDTVGQYLAEHGESVETLPGYVE